MSRTKAVSRYSSCALAVLMVMHAALILYGAALHSTSMDEPSHLASGVLNLRTGNYEPYRVNPPLYRQLAALPVVLGPYQPLPDSFAEVAAPHHRSEWQSGRAFAELNQVDYMKIVFRARLAGALWSCLGLWLVWKWGTALGGPGAGLLAGTIWCFEPNIVAHAQLVGPDLPCAVAGLLAMWVLRGYALQPDWLRAAFAGATLGIALLTKFTVLLVVPVWLVVLFTSPISRQTARRRWLIRGAHLGLAGSVALAVLNAGYECTKFGSRLDELEFVSATFSGNSPRPGEDDTPPGNRFRDSALASVRLPIPADYVLGMDVQQRDFERGRHSVSSYLAGEMKAGGWWYYYLYGLGVKVPCGFILLMVGGLGLGVRRHFSPQWREIVLLFAPTVLIVAGVSTQTGFNHHVRYVLPALPFLIVGAGWFGAVAARWGRLAGLLVAIACLWGVGSHIRYFPHSLSYFNELAGGPANGHAHLIDSNIDWGQDLMLLKDWEEAHPEARPIHYALFTSLPTEQWGLSGGPAMYSTRLPPELPSSPPQPGWYAVSVSVMRGRPTSQGRLSEPLQRYFQGKSPTDRVGYSLLIFHVEDR